MPTRNCRKRQYETSVPTVADRVAQTVVAEELKSRAEAIFHDDSYGYRPGRAAEHAVELCRQRCWKTDWVIDLDIQKFLDASPHCGFC
jgi:RNA-directed DNA polymerase